MRYYRYVTGFVSMYVLYIMLHWTYSIWDHKVDNPYTLAPIIGVLYLARYILAPALSSMAGYFITHSWWFPPVAFLAIIPASAWFVNRGDYVPWLLKIDIETSTIVSLITIAFIASIKKVVNLSKSRFRQ